MKLRIIVLGFMVLGTVMFMNFGYLPITKGWYWYTIPFASGLLFCIIGDIIDLIKRKKGQGA